MPLGIVIRKSPGVTRWARWVWKPVGLLPGAPDADWRELRRDGDSIDYHAATLPLELWRADAEAYKAGLSARVPTVAVVMREAERGPAPVTPELVTASPYEAQDYMDSGEEIVELVPMPAGLIAWVRDFTEAHYEAEVFRKRRRDRTRIDLVEDGKGDPRIAQLSDVYRAPRAGRAGG